MLAAALSMIAGSHAPSLPDSMAVEGALSWQAGSWCRYTIDDCLDEQGNDIDPSPIFTVSDLKCRPAAKHRVICSFASVKSFGPDDVQAGEHCKGTLVSREHDNGATSWSFVVPDPMRKPYVALLSCN